MHPFASLSPLKTTDWWCHFSFVMDQFFGAATVLWYTMVALNTWLAIRGTKPTTIARLRPYQHILSWGYPLVITIPPLAMQSYAPMSQSYCWFANPSDPWRFTFYAVVLLSLAFCVFLLVYTLLAYCLKWHAFRNDKMDANAVILRITFIVMVYVIFWSVALVGRLQNYFLGREQFQYHLISLTSSGICNFVVWGITSPKVIRQWGRLISCCRLKPKQPIVPPGMLPSDVEISMGPPRDDDYPVSDGIDDLDGIPEIQESVPELYPGDGV